MTEDIPIVNSNAKVDPEDMENRIQYAYELKRQADEELKLSNYEKATNNYSEAIIQIKNVKAKTGLLGDRMQMLIKEIVIPCNLNMTFIDIKECRWDDAINHATKVLNADNQNNTKARYRRCLAYIQKKYFSDAENDLRILKESIVGSAELKTLEALLEEKRLEKVDQEGEIYKKMMRHLKQANNSIDYESRSKLGKKVADVQSYMSNIYQYIKNALCGRCMKKKPKVKV